MTDAAVADCLFCRIVAGQLPADEVYRDDDVVVFADIDPQAPVHLLVVPTRHAENAAELGRADPLAAGRLLAVAGSVAATAGLTGYRIVFNTGAEAGQSVFHVHAHVLGGRPLSWPPG